MVCRYWGRTLLTLDVIFYQPMFQLNLNNLALVSIFNFYNNIRFQLSADVFQKSQ